MPITDPLAKSSQRKKGSSEEARVKLPSEFVALELPSGTPGFGRIVAWLAEARPVTTKPTMLRLAVGTHAASGEDNSPEAVEAAALLQRINADLAVEEALVAQLMSRHGL